MMSLAGLVSVDYDLPHSNNSTSESGGLTGAKAHRVLLELSAALVTVAALYLLCCLSLYIRDKRSRSGKKPGMLKLRNEILCLVSAGFLLARCLCEQIGFHASSSTACVLYKYLYTITYHSSMIPLYLLLWLRQRKLCQDKNLKRLLSPWVRKFSKVVFFAYVTFSLASAYFYLYMFEVGISDSGCVHDPKMFDERNVKIITSVAPPSRIIAVVALFFSVGLPSFQVLFLLLFLYPLARHYNPCRTRRARSQEDQEEQSGEANDRAAPIRAVMKRCTKCTCVCVISDLLLFGSYSLVYHSLISISSWSLLVNCSGATHNAVIIYSLKDWKGILLVWKRSRRWNRRRSRHSGVTFVAGGQSGDKVHITTTAVRPKVSSTTIL